MTGRDDGPAELLHLPPRARVSERLSRRVLRDQVAGGAGTAEARLIDKIVESARVVGILRPETIGVPARRDTEPPGREVTDVAVLHVETRPAVTEAQRRRLVELVQRALPRPVVLVVAGSDRETELSLALTHVSRTDPDRRTSVIDAALTVSVADLPAGALDIRRCDRTDLWALYRDLVLRAACGGRPADPALTADDAVSLATRVRALDIELGATVRRARQALSQRERITANTEARALRDDLAALRSKLCSSDETRHRRNQH